MKIDKLDEFQGLTVDMVREWLEIHGWEVRECGNGSTDAKKRFTDRVSVLRCDWDFCLGWLLTRVAAAERMSVQALLREINPRMRKGMPSDAALAEHDEWIVCTPFGATFIAEISYGGSDDGFSIMMPPINDHCDAEFIAEKHWPECLFWPCDEHGNKVRWPTDAEGKML